MAGRQKAQKKPEQKPAKQDTDGEDAPGMCLTSNGS